MDGSTLGHAHVGRLECCDSFAMKKVYCSCGRIVDLDVGYFNRRIGLGKAVECIHCRNIRISREIDDLNSHFSGESECDSDCFVL